LIFPIRGSLESPKKFNSLFVPIAIFFVAVYMGFGLICHMGLGSNVKEIIFYNFPKSYLSVYVLQFLYGFGILSTFPVYVQTNVNIMGR